MGDQRLLRIHYSGDNGKYGLHVARHPMQVLFNYMLLGLLVMPV